MDTSVRSLKLTGSEVKIAWSLEMSPESLRHQLTYAHPSSLRHQCPVWKDPTWLTRGPPLACCMSVSDILCWMCPQHITWGTVVGYSGHFLVQVICRTSTCVWGSRELLTTRIHSLRSQQRQSVLAFMRVRCEYILQF